MVKNTKKTKKDTNFRVYAKRMFLTYSQVTEKLTHQEVLQQLQRKHTVNRFIVAEERHQDQGKHFHVLLESKTKFNVRKSSDLDISFEDQNFHGNYQEARNYKRVASYIAKDKNYITNYPNFVDGEFLSVEEDIVRRAPELGAEETARYFLKNYPANALKGINVRNAESFVQAIIKTSRESKNSQAQIEQEKPLPFQLADFTLPDNLKNWIQQGCQPTLLLVGEGGTYKTSFCKVLAQHMGWNMLTCNHIEALKGLTEQHNAVLFDDMSLNALDEQQLLALVESDQEKQMRVLHAAVNKPAGLHQMITLNPNVLKGIKKKLGHKQFLRRLQLVLVDKPLVVNVNVNLQINNHTHIYNNEERIAENKRILDSL